MNGFRTGNHWYITPLLMTAAMGASAAVAPLIVPVTDKHFTEVMNGATLLGIAGLVWRQSAWQAEMRVRLSTLLHVVETKMDRAECVLTHSEMERRMERVEDKIDV